MIEIKIIQKNPKKEETTLSTEPKQAPKMRETLPADPPAPKKLYNITAVAWRRRKQIRAQAEPWLTSERWAVAWAEEMEELYKNDKYIINVEEYFTKKNVLHYSNF